MSKRKGGSSRAATLSRLFEDARTAWPELELSIEDFSAHVCERIAGEDDAVEALTRLHGNDVFLALACARGDARALASFEQHVMAQVPAHIARIDASPTFADEVKQHLREKLFVGRAGAPPKIASYSGRGPLGGWLRVAAIRAAHNLRRAAATTSSPARAVAPLGALDPELEYLKRRYGRVFQEIVEAELRRVESAERALLRLHYGDGLSVRAIAKLYRVNASTISRRLSRIGEQLLHQTRSRLRDQLTLDERELESLLALVQSRIDVTLTRVLRTEPARKGG